MKRLYSVPRQHVGTIQINLAVLVFFAITVFFLLTEHRAHLFGTLPFLPLLACPFLHSFKHRGHDGNGEYQHPHGSKGGKT